MGTIQLVLNHFLPSFPPLLNTGDNPLNPSSTCTCCQMVEVNSLKVPMYCPQADVYYMKEIQVPKACLCLACGEGDQETTAATAATEQQLGLEGGDAVNFGSSYGPGEASQYQESRGPRDWNNGPHQVMHFIMILIVLAHRN